MLESVRAEDWPAVALANQRIKTLWTTVKSKPQPPRLVTAIDETLAVLDRAVTAKDPVATSQAAVNLGQSALDRHLLYRDAAGVEIDRLHVHAQQLRVDAANDSKAGVVAEVAAIEWTAQRILARLTSADRDDAQARLHALRTAGDVNNLSAAADHAARLAAWLRGSMNLANQDEQH